MRIARSYLIDVEGHCRISLFDEDIEGKTEAEINAKVKAMAQVSIGQMFIKQTRLHVPDVQDTETVIPGRPVWTEVIADEEVIALVQAELDKRRGEEDTDR